VNQAKAVNWVFNMETEVPIGIVVSSPQGPNTGYYQFLVKGTARKGQFAGADCEGGKLIGMVVEIHCANKYFEKAEGVSDFSHSALITDSLPVGEWEYRIATVRVLGLLKQGKIHRPETPLSPGCQVFCPKKEELATFLGLEDAGLVLGQVANSGLEARVGADRLLSKHLSILAMSGAGKSHLASVLIEELLSRKAEHGRLAVVVFDIHGEYATFSSGDFARQARIVRGSEIKIPLGFVSAGMIQSWYPGITQVAMHTLEAALYETKKAKEGVEQLIGRVERSGARDNIKSSLLPWLYKLRRLELIGAQGQPSIKSIARPGRLCVFDLSGIDSQKKRQIIVQYFATRLFKKIRCGQVAPTVMMLEEAHNFAPEKARKGSAVAKQIVEKIAREGRKFGFSLCLISQRPVHLSVTALSQCNSSIILRIVNPNDLKNIETSCEGIDEHMLRAITTLRTGDSILLGEAVNYPVFLKVRQRKTMVGRGGGVLTHLARKFEAQALKDRKSVEAYI